MVDSDSNRRLQIGRYDIASFLTYAIYAAGSVVIPVSLVELARELGFSLEAGGLTAGGALQIGRTAALVCAMLACGFAAARWGIRGTLGWSILAMGAGMALCAFAPNYVMLLLALSVAGLGEGVIEGLATPFVQQLHAREPGRYVNLSHAFWSVGVFITVLAAGWLLSVGVSWRVITAGVAALSLAPALLLVIPRKGVRAEMAFADSVPAAAVWGHASAIVREPRFWRYFAAMFVAGGGEFCLTFWCASYIQLHFAAAAWAGGVGTACFAAGMMAGRIGSGWLLHQNHLRSLIIGSGAAGVVITLLLPVIGHMNWFFVVLFAAGIASAPYWPSIQSYSADRLPDTDTTMLMILLACAGVPGCGFFTWLMGFIGNHTGGLQSAFYLVPACYLALTILIATDGRTETTNAVR
ncbi:MAG TPA: MFS transporter [Armatimonadota bacterium]